jgi:threonine dehydratase
MAILPDLRTIREARKLLAPHLPITRTIPAHSLRGPNMAVHLKLETELPTGSFKPRGALYALAVNLARRRVEEVTASSTGNHGVRSLSRPKHWADQPPSSCRRTPIQ